MRTGYEGAILGLVGRLNRWWCAWLICCSVDDYIVKQATLRLKHNHPVSDSPKTVNVNVEHVLESISRHEVDVGSWINVIGYVEQQRRSKDVHVQAIAIWDAGDVDLEAYQKAVEKRKATS